MNTKNARLARTTLLCALALIATRSTPAELREPPNLGLLKQEIRAFYRDGTYEALCRKIADQAIAIINQWQGEGQPALILEVDDTAISTIENLLSQDFAYSPPQWRRWANRANAPAIPTTLEIYQAAHQNNFAIYFITGRDETLREATRKNLQRAGYENYHGLIMKQEGDWRPTSRYKISERKKLTEQGYTIVLNISDQQNELEGGYAQHALKLPNPAYTIK